jgi:aminoglycoside phosphotransferase (APT) family kinase protein
MIVFRFSPKAMTELHQAASTGRRSPVQQGPIARLNHCASQDSFVTTRHHLRAASDTHPIDQERLAGYLAGAGFRFDAGAGIRQFAAGLANINYLLQIDGRPVVLRRPPDGALPPGAHDMAREHDVLSHLSKVFALAPDSLHLCSDAGVIGVPFQLIEYRDGIVIKGDDASLFNGAPETAKKVGETLVETMAALHRVDATTAGLGDLGRPEGFLERAVAGWRERAERLKPDGPMKRLVTEIGTWLSQQKLGTRPATLLHCDIKLDNLILDPGTLAPVALVDWDMGTRGDPLFDLATLLSYWSEPGDPPAMHRLAQMPTVAAGFQSRADIATLYGVATGTDLTDLPIVQVLCQFKLATVFHQLYATYGQGPEAREPYRGFANLSLGLYELTHAQIG